MGFNTRCRNSIVSLLFLSVTFLSQTGRAQGTWTPLTNFSPHYNAGVMLLLTDGTVMCKTSSGGTNGNVWDKLTPDINGSYTNGTWTSLAPMIDDRLYFSSQVLRDGRVYVAGGEYGSGGYNSEVYDPLTNTWTPCPVLSGGEHISDANSEILPDGTVLQAVVGSGSRRTYLWDPVTNTYTTGPTAFGSHNESAWAKLPDNSILYVDINSTNSERYIPATNTWVHDGTVPVGLYDPFGSEMGGSFLLPDGRVFFIGAYGQHALYTPSFSTSPGTWSAAPATPTEGAPDAASSMCVDGKVLFTLSPLPTSADHFPPPTAFYEFDYVTNTISPVTAPTGGASMTNSAYITNMLCLPDGTVLFCNQGDDQYYQYTPAGAPLAIGKPTVSTVYRVDCDTFKATGTLFNGISEGASYGDDWQMETNYPIIRLTSGTNVYYTRTTYWNTTGVMRGALPDTTTFVLPAGLPVGTYNLEVVANGIASDPFPINTNMNISPSTASVCVGSTASYTDPWPGGTWSSNNTSIATIDAFGVATGVAIGSTTITYMMGACYKTASITVGSGATITPSGPVVVCPSSSTGLSASIGGGTWSSGNTAIATVSSGGSVTGVASGTVNISYVIGSGCSAVKSVTVSTLPGATITAVGATTICSGGTATLNANTGSGYTYQWRIGGSPIGGATSSSYTTSTAGNYSVVVTNANGCSSTSSVTTVTISSAPPAIITPGGPTTFCTGGSVVLSASTGGGFTYQWRTGASPIAGATASAYTASTAGNYTVIVTNTAGCSTTSSITAVTVTPGPGATITPAGPTTFCVPGSVVLNANTGAGLTYQWQVGGSSIPGATASSYTASTSGNYTVIVSQGVCVVTSAIVTVTATSASAGIITGPTGVCLGQTMTLTDAVPGGTWSSSNTSLATINSFGVVSGLVVGTVTISYSVTTTCGSAVATTPINVSAGTTVASIGGSLTVCPGGITTLTDATPSGTWSSDNLAIATIGSASGIASGVSIGTANVSYNVTNAMGCVSRATAVLNVASTFAATITAGGPTTFCTGANVVLNASTGAGMHYQWKKNGTNIPGATATAYVANTSGNYTVLETAPSGCNATSAITVVTVTSGTIVVPSVSIAATPGTLFCLSTTSTAFTALPVNGGGAPAYQWYVNATSVGSGPSYTYTPTAGDIVRVVLTSNATCAFPITAQARDTIKVVSPSAPSVSISPNKSAVCVGDTITFSAVPVFGGTAPTYTWKLNGIYIGIGSSYTYRPSNGDVLQCTMTSNYACLTAATATGSYTVHVQPTMPNVVTISVTKSGIAFGTVDTFIAIAPYAGSSPAYQWLINGLAISGATNSIYVTAALMNGQEISCRVTSSNPCVHPQTLISNGIKVNVWGVGVQKVSATGSSFTLVPNPNKGEFTIEGTLVTSGDENVNIVITNMLGQTVHTEHADAINGKLEKHITLSNTLANGSYLVTITSGADHVVYHIVVDR